MVVFPVLYHGYGVAPARPAHRRDPGRMEG
jgi:hypothetical protein